MLNSVESAGAGRESRGEASHDHLGPSPQVCVLVWFWTESNPASLAGVAGCDASHCIRLRRSAVLTARTTARERRMPVSVFPVVDDRVGDSGAVESGVWRFRLCTDAAAAAHADLADLLPSSCKLRRAASRLLWHRTLIACQLPCREYISVGGIPWTASLLAESDAFSSSPAAPPCGTWTPDASHAASPLSSPAPAHPGLDSRMLSSGPIAHGQRDHHHLQSLSPELTLARLASNATAADGVQVGHRGRCGAQVPARPSRTSMHLSRRRPNASARDRELVRPCTASLSRGGSGLSMHCPSGCTRASQVAVWAGDDLSILPVSHT